MFLVEEKDGKDEGFKEIQSCVFNSEAFNEIFPVSSTKRNFFRKWNIILFFSYYIQTTNKPQKI